LAVQGLSSGGAKSFIYPPYLPLIKDPLNVNEVNSFHEAPANGLLSFGLVLINTLGPRNGQRRFTSRSGRTGNKVWKIEGGTLLEIITYYYYF
jgi:hypothetical protein